MLVLSRNKGEVVVLGPSKDDLIRLAVVDFIHHDKVSLKVDREDVTIIQSEKQISAKDNFLLKKNESVQIATESGSGSGDCVVVVIVEIRSGKVRLGFDCPKQWTLHRLEVWEAIQR